MKKFFNYIIQLFQKVIRKILKPIAYAKGSCSEFIQKFGINIVPTDFYSNTPTIQDIKNSFEYIPGQIPFDDNYIFHRKNLAAHLKTLIPFAYEFTPPDNNDIENPDSFFWNNDQFSYSDAMSYYCFIRKLKPKKIVEIGSGFSTLIAMEALKQNGIGKIICIEPYPRKFIETNQSIKLIKKIAQDISSKELNNILQDGDILFIDSTHTVKSGSDCLNIYLRLIPQIRKKIFIHVHDIFLPFGMPFDWVYNKKIHWTEQYLLFAFLLDNQKTEVLFGSNVNREYNKPLLDKLMGGKKESGGGSFWFSYNGSKDRR